MDTIKVILADDHGILRYGLRLFLSKAEDIKIVGEASTGDECIRVFKKKSPDICLIDIEMPHKNGIEVVSAIKELDTSAKLIILSMHSDIKTLQRAKTAGADGYLRKNISKQDILDAIRAVYNGEQVFCDMISRSHTNNAPKSTQNSKALHKITNREREILQLVVGGFSSPQIAEKLYISRRTVDTHRNNIMQKLDINNTASLVRFALQHNLINDSNAPVA